MTYSVTNEDDFTLRLHRASIPRRRPKLLQILSENFKEDMIIQSDWGPGKVVSVDILSMKYKVETEKNGVVEVDVNNGSKK